jgi:hypothetical protein
VKEFAERYWKIKQAERCGVCSTHIGDKHRIKIDQDTERDKLLSNTKMKLVEYK